MKATTLIPGILAAAFLSNCGVSDSGYNGGSYANASTPRVTALSNGNYSVSMGNGKIATLNQYGSVLSSANMSPAEKREAGEAVRTHRREQSGSDEHSPPGGFGGSSQEAPVVRPRSDGKLEVQVPSGGVVLYDQNGRMIQKGSSVSGGDLYNANRAVQSYLREQ